MNNTSKAKHKTCLLLTIVKPSPMFYTTYAATLALALLITSAAARASPLAGGESTSTTADTLPVSDIVLTPVTANFTSASARNSVRPDATVP